MWSLILDRHIDVLRANLLHHKDWWLAIATRAKVGRQTVGGFVMRYQNYLNPGTETLKAIADAYEALEREEEHMTVLEQTARIERELTQAHHISAGEEELRAF